MVSTWLSLLLCAATQTQALKLQTLPPTLSELPPVVHVGKPFTVDSPEEIKSSLVQPAVSAAAVQPVAPSAPVPGQAAALRKPALAETVTAVLVPVTEVLPALPPALDAVKPYTVDSLQDVASTLPSAALVQPTAVAAVDAMNALGSGQASGGPTVITAHMLQDAEGRFTGGSQQANHSNIGGDRMAAARHNYAPIYAKFLPTVLASGQTPTIAEIGILTCTGVAMWSRIFPQSSIYGFDYDLSSCNDNMANLVRLGFQQQKLTLTHMDQFQPSESNAQLARSVLQTAKPNIIIDDGAHDVRANTNTFWAFRQQLADCFVYFIEDVTADRKAATEALGRDVASKLPGATASMECPSPTRECMLVVRKC